MKYHYACGCSYEGDGAMLRCPIHKDEAIVCCVDCQEPIDNDIWCVCNRCNDLADKELDKILEPETKYTVIVKVEIPVMALSPQDAQDKALNAIQTPGLSGHEFALLDIAVYAK